MRYVIIGNSVAAIAAIEAIREADKKGELTAISDERYINYSRPLISYFLGGEIGEERMAFRGEKFYREHGVNIISGKKADALDVKGMAVKAGGEIFHFDRLLITTGGSPILPPIKGAEGMNGIFTFTRFSDAVAIKKYIDENEVDKAVVLGGGLIGLKACEALLFLKKKVVIVELADRLLSATFDRKASAIVEDALKKREAR